MLYVSIFLFLVSIWDSCVCCAYLNLEFSKAHWINFLKFLKIKASRFQTSTWSFLFTYVTHAPVPLEHIHYARKRKSFFEYFFFLRLRNIDLFKIFAMSQSRKINLCDFCTPFPEQSLRLLLEIFFSFIRLSTWKYCKYLLTSSWRSRSDFFELAMVIT